MSHEPVEMTGAIPAEDETRIQARAAKRAARREEREARKHNNPPGARRLTKRLIAAGVPEETSGIVARHVLGEDGDPPDITADLTIQGMKTLLRLASRSPRADELLEPLRQRTLRARRKVKDWDTVHEMLNLMPRRIGPDFEAQVARMGQHPAAIAAGVDDATIEGWRQSARLGLLTEVMKDRRHPFPKPFRAALGDVGATSAADWADPQGTIFVAVHNTHLNTLRRWAIASFANHHVVRKLDVIDPSGARAQLLAFARTLRKGGAGVIAPDGASGTVDRELDLYGEPLPIADAFARIAWTTRCRLVFAVASSQGRRVGLDPQLTELPRRTDEMTDVEAYVDMVLEALAAAVRRELVRLPFDTGLSFRLGAEGREVDDDGDDD